METALLHVIKRRDEMTDELSQEDLRKTLTVMHQGLLNMQSRLDDHGRVIEKLMVIVQNMTARQVPNGYRNPKDMN